MGGKEERRNHARFKVESGVFAVLGPYSVQMGQIVDISESGLAFHYKKGGEIIADSYEVSILFDGTKDASYSPFKFNAKAVSDVAVANESPFSTAVIRRFGMQFSGLTYYQRSWLTECIRNHTTGKVASSTG